MARKEPTETTLEVRLLGDLAVLRGGQALTLPASKKTRALLGYLVATGRAHLRERLCELLWEGPDDPRAALRWSLTKLRPIVDDAGARCQLVADRERVSFEPGAARIDLLGVRAALAGNPGEADTAALVAAAEQFRGPFLEGLDVPGCHRFNAWCVGEREELRSLHLAVRRTLVARLAGSPEQALRHARALVALDPLAEASHLTVIRLLGELGQAREALEQYERCRRILETELGSRPSPELEEARRSLTRRPLEGPAPAPVLAPPACLEPTSLPLVGRQDERAALLSCLQATRAGQGREVLLLLGDPGVGKSRLLEELRAQALAAGSQVLTGRAFEAELVRPYGAWIDALRPTARSGSLPFAEGPGTVPRDDLRWSERRALREESESADRVRLFDAVTAFLRELGPAVVILDDLQWLDEASVALLHYAARALEGTPVLLAAAARAGELGDNQAALRLVRGLDRERRLRQILLGPLDAAATAELVRAVDAAVDPARVFDDSEGNPLYALEIARALRAGASRVDESLDGLIGERLERLDERARQIVPFAAALGRSFDPEVLSSVTGVPNAELLSALDELERRGVVRAAGGAGYDFSHDLVRRAAYQQMSEPRRRLVHLQIARAVAALADPDDALASDVAHHAALGGDSLLCARACIRACRRCLRLFAYAGASELDALGLHHAATLPRPQRLPLEIELLGLMISPHRASHTDPALGAQLSRAILEAQDAGLHAAAAQGFYFRSFLQYLGGDAAGAEESSMRRAEVARVVDGTTGGLHMAGTARCLVMLERELPRAAAILDEAERLLGPNSEDLNLHWGRGLLDQHGGDLDRAVYHMERALALARRHELHWEECDCLLRLTMIELERGRPETALARGREVELVAEKLGEAAEQPTARALVATALRAVGEHAEPLEPALASLRSLGANGKLAMVLNLAAERDLADGDPETAARRAAEALEAATLVSLRSQAIVAGALLAQAALARNDHEAARRHAETARLALDETAGASTRARAALVAAEGALTTRGSVRPLVRSRA